MPSQIVQQQFSLLNNVENNIFVSSTHRTKSFTHRVRGSSMYLYDFFKRCLRAPAKKNLCRLVVTVGRVVGQLTGKSQLTRRVRVRVGVKVKVRVSTDLCQFFLHFYYRDFKGHEVRNSLGLWLWVGILFLIFIVNYSRFRKAVISRYEETIGIN